MPHAERGPDAPTQDAPLSARGSARHRAAPPAGQRIGRYIVERTLGQGGMGIVVAARHQHLDERVAIKLLHPKGAKDAVQVGRFVREARATVRIKSEHVVRVLDAGVDESNGAPFIVMECLEGRDLGQVLAADGALPMQVAVDYTIQICEAVAAAHALGIIHRDLKPSNFFLTTRIDGMPLVKVLDFGISKAAQADGEPDPRLTDTQAVFGSPTYMSPEQIRSSKNVDPRSDVWSLGVALFEMMTGKLPFAADNVAGLLAAVIADPPLRLSELLPHVPRELEATVLACLEKEPARRIASTAELAARLAPYASAEGARVAAGVERVVRGAGGSSPNFPPPSEPNVSGLETTVRTAHRSSVAPTSPLRPAPSGPPHTSSTPGTTALDLSTTGARASRTGGDSARRVPLVMGVLLLAALLVGAATVVVRGRDAPHAASVETGPRTVIAPPEPPSVAAAPAGPAPELVTAEPPAASSVPLASRATVVNRAPLRPAPAGKHAPHKVTRAPSASPSVAPALAPPPPRPPAVPSANLDSRF